jgi:hypothetical protein
MQRNARPSLAVLALVSGWVAVLLWFSTPASVSRPIATEEVGGATPVESRPRWVVATQQVGGGTPVESRPRPPIATQEVGVALRRAERHPLWATGVALRAHEKETEVVEHATHMAEHAAEVKIPPVVRSATAAAHQVHSRETREAQCPGALGTPAAPTPADLSRADPDTLDIVEAVFRFEIKTRSTWSGHHTAYLTLFGKVPPAELLGRLEGMPAPVLPGPALDYPYGAIVEGGIVYWVSNIGRISSTKAIVEGGWRESELAGEGITYTVDLIDGTWTVTCPWPHLWITS